MNGGWMLFVEKGSTEHTLPYLFNIETSTGRETGVTLNNVMLTDCFTSTGFLAKGNGFIKINNPQKNPANRAFKMSSASMNLLLDGIFANTFKDKIWISKDTATPTDNYGINIEFLSNSSQTSTAGSGSISLHKKTASGNNACVSISTPIERNSIIRSCQNLITNNGDIGSLIIRVKGAYLLDNVSSRISPPTIMNEVVIDTITVNTIDLVPNASQNKYWYRIFNASNEFIFPRLPTWATHYIIEFDLTNCDAGTLVLDDLVINEFTV
jgi:hypothetical protein